MSWSAEDQREYEALDRKAWRLAQLAAVLAAGRCSPTGETLIDAGRLVEDAQAILNAADDVAFHR